MSRLRSQSEGPRGRRLRGELLQANLLDNSTAIVTAAASGYGRALASAAIASAHRCARRARPDTPNSSTASTAPSTPAHRRARRQIEQGTSASSRAQSVDIAAGANNVQDGSASDIEDLRLDVSDTGSVVDTEVQSQGDILDRVIAATFQRHAPETERNFETHEPMLPRLTEGDRIGSRPPLLQVGGHGISNLVHRSSSPPPQLRTDRSDRSSATSTPSRPTSVGRSPSAAAIANAAGGYGRALAAAAVASSLRRVAARPPAHSEDSNLSNLPVNSRSFMHGSVAVGGHGSVLARTGRDVLVRSPPP